MIKDFQVAGPIYILILLVFVIALFVGVYLTWRERKKETPRKIPGLLRWIFYISISIWFGSIILSCPGTPFLCRSLKPKAQDARRVADLGQMQLVFELYADKEQRLGHEWAYPKVESGCVPMSFYEGIGLEEFIFGIPKDPEDTAENYMVSVSDDQQTYIMRAVFKNNENSALDADIDGIVLGCSCDDPAYCVGP